MAQTYYIVLGHIKSDYSHCSQFSNCCLCQTLKALFQWDTRGKLYLSLLLYSVLSISALGMEVFWRWIVKSDTGCVGLCDMLEAKRE